MGRCDWRYWFPKARYDNHWTWRSNSVFVDEIAFRNRSHVLGSMAMFAKRVLRLGFSHDFETSE